MSPEILIFSGAQTIKNALKKPESLTELRKKRGTKSRELSSFHIKQSIKDCLITEFPKIIIDENNKYQDILNILIELLGLSMSAFLGNSSISEINIRSSSLHSLRPSEIPFLVW